MQINHRAYILKVQWHNQRLKLTETAVSFSPHAKTFFREMASSAARAVYRELAVRRRSLYPRTVSRTTTTQDQWRQHEIFIRCRSCFDVHWLQSK